MKKYNFCSQCGNPMKYWDRVYPEFDVETGEKLYPKRMNLLCERAFIIQTGFIKASIGSESHDWFEPQQVDVTTFEESTRGIKSFVYGAVPDSDVATIDVSSSI